MQHAGGLDGLKDDFWDSVMTTMYRPKAAWQSEGWYNANWSCTFPHFWILVLIPPWLGWGSWDRPGSFQSCSSKLWWWWCGALLSAKVPWRKLPFLWMWLMQCNVQVIFKSLYLSVCSPKCVFTAYSFYHRLLFQEKIATWRILVLRGGNLGCNPWVGDQ